MGAIIGLAAIFPASVAALPADRGYELVTPSAKPAEIFWSGIGLGFGVTPDGEHLFFNSDQSVTQDASAWPTAYRADRGTDGWHTRSALPGGAWTGDALIDFFSPNNLTVAVKTLRSYDPADTDAPFDNEDFYTFAVDGTSTFVSPNLVSPGPGSGEQKNILGMSEDGKSVLFYASFSPMVSAAVGYGGQQLYEYHDGRLALVAVDNNGQRLADQDVRFGSGSTAFNAYSRDGSRTFFTVDSTGLFVRVDHDQTDPIPAAPAGANADSSFVGATPDGSKAFFVTTRQLALGDTDSSADLYVYDVAAKTSERLSAGPSPAGVQTQVPVWASEDGQRVYFEATGALAPGADPSNVIKTYVWDHGMIKLVANAHLIAQSMRPACAPEIATPDGRYFAFETTLALTPDDLDGGAVDIYRYDAVTGDLRRVSTGPADAQTEDGAFLGAVSHLAGRNGCDGTFMMTPRHPMSDDGHYVFFGTQAALVGADVNAKFDVYQWDARNDITSLISSGRGADHSDLAEATPSGSDVFFVTRDRLVPSDQDDEADVYDARVGSVTPKDDHPVPCSESGCQRASSSPPSFDAPASLSLFAKRSDGAPGAKGKVRISALTAHQRRLLLQGKGVTVRIVAPARGMLDVHATLVSGPARLSVLRVHPAAVAQQVLRVRLHLNDRARRLAERHRFAALRISAHEEGQHGARIRVRLRRSTDGKQ